jgi:hypothetical protein
MRLSIGSALRRPDLSCSHRVGTMRIPVVVALGVSAAVVAAGCG